MSEAARPDGPRLCAGLAAPRPPLTGRTPAQRHAAQALLFFRQWVRHPLRTAAIAPSSRCLAELITSEISPETAPVIELGPGTGAFTEALLRRGVPESRLALIEFGEDFAGLLRRRFPRATVLQGDAAELASFGPLFGADRPGAVVSGIPLVQLPADRQRKLLAAAFGMLREGGAFYQFTYGPVAPARREVLAEFGLQATRLGFVARNLPPASVYRFSRSA